VADLDLDTVLEYLYEHCGPEETAGDYAALVAAAQLDATLGDLVAEIEPYEDKA
jgi:hypothetical protein